METLEELKQFIETQNLTETFTSLEVPQMFDDLTTPAGIDRQSGNFATLPYDARFWLSYNQYSDQFTFCISYFNHDGNKIPQSVFAEALPHLPAAQYNETNERIWIKDADVYRLQPIPNAVIRLSVRTIVRK